MFRPDRVAGTLFLVVVALLAASCAKISAPAGGPGTIPVETLVTHDAVPADWGELVSVSSAGEYPDLVQLWFRGADGTVRYAVVSLRSHEVLNAHVIHRK